MPNDDRQDGGQIGDPYAMDSTPVKPADCPADQRVDSMTGTDVGVRRKGDTGLGDPEGPAEVIRTLTAQETHDHEQKTEKELQERFEQKLAELADADRGWVLPYEVRVAAIWVLIVISAVLGLALVAQSAQVMVDISRLPPYAQWLAGAGAILFGSVLAFVLIKLLWLVLKLSRSPRINVKALGVLQKRHQIQHLAVTRQADAKKELQAYLRGYPLDHANSRTLTAAGLKNNEIKTLEGLRTRLLDTNRPVSPGEWLGEFSSGFQGVLDDAARRRIRRYVKQVCVGTAMSPVSYVDQMIVIYCCSAMVKDLLQIYHLRPAFGQTTIIMARGIVHTYLSGFFEDVTETTADGLKDMMGDVLGSLAGTIGSAVSAKTAEASLNGLLLWTLGKATIKQLQPCTVHK